MFVQQGFIFFTFKFKSWQRRDMTQLLCVISQDYILCTFHSREITTMDLFINTLLVARIAALRSIALTFNCFFIVCQQNIEEDISGNKVSKIKINPSSWHLITHSSNAINYILIIQGVHLTLKEMNWAFLFLNLVRVFLGHFLYIHFYKQNNKTMIFSAQKWGHELFWANLWIREICLGL